MSKIRDWKLNLISDLIRDMACEKLVEKIKLG